MTDLTGTDRILVDRLWREEAMHKTFCRNTGVMMCHGVEEYERLFRTWGKALLDGGQEAANAAVKADRVYAQKYRKED